MLNVYIGYDRREDEAYRVACASAQDVSSKLVAIHRLDARDLYQRRLLWRPVEVRDGQMRDHLSGAPQSTEFASSRFVVPFIQKTGWSLFADCDVVFMADLAELFALADNRYAVMCVQHGPLHGPSVKMDGQVQTVYSRKAWSSVMLLNADHEAWNRLTLAMVNQYPGELLHRFFWLRDSEIGALPPEWNWLVGCTPKPEAPKIAHFTLGVPIMPGYENSEHADIWYAARDRANRVAA